MAPKALYILYTSHVLRVAMQHQCGGRQSEGKDCRSQKSQRVNPSPAAITFFFLNLECMSLHENRIYCRYCNRRTGGGQLCVSLSLEFTDTSVQHPSGFLDCGSADWRRHGVRGGEGGGPLQTAERPGEGSRLQDGPVQGRPPRPVLHPEDRGHRRARETVYF